MVKDMFRGYRVHDCKNVEEFLDKYYKHDRYKGRGQEYADLLLAGHKKDFAIDGVDWISRHDSVAGRTVSFYYGD